MIRKIYSRISSADVLLLKAGLSMIPVIFALLGPVRHISAQSILAQWPLNNTFNAVNFDANNLDNASYAYGDGIFEWPISYYNLGGDWYDFTANNVTEPNDYIQFQLSPKTGSNAKNIYITHLELEMEQKPWNSFAGPRNYRIDYSKDSGFSPFTTASSGSLSTVFTNCDITFNAPLEVFSGETLYFRVYGYNSDNQGDMIVRKNDFTVKGYVEAATAVNPVPALEFSQDCANTANLLFDLPAGFNPANQTILIFAKAGSPVNFGSSTALLSAYPNADNNLATFGGSPYENDPNARLVYRGTTAGPVSLINLTPGQQYYFVAYNFNNPGGSGNISGGSYASGSVSGSIPEVEPYSAIATSRIVNLEFTAPNCVDAVMIVAKEGSVTAVPSGNGSAYIPDPDFTGSGTVFDGGKVVYNSLHTSGSAGAVSVFNLTNKTAYYFKTFVRKGTSWSPGKEITVTPDISPLVITQVQARNKDFFEFLTLTRMDLSNLNITDQGVCASGAVFMSNSIAESEYEDFFNSTGNSDITTPLTDVPAGTFVLVYSGNHPVDLDYSDGLIVLRNSGLSFDPNGDQTMIYTGNLPGIPEDCGALPNPIVAGIDFASTTGYITSGTPDPNTSYIPDTPAAFETLNPNGNSRYKKGNPRGDSTVIFAAIMNPANWTYNDQNADYWLLKKVQFQKSNKQGGNIVFNGITGSEFTMDASGLTFYNTTYSTRYMVVVYDNGEPKAPVNRYTCYQPNTDYTLAPDVVTSVDNQISSGDPCGTPVTGNGKVVYFDYGLPAALTVTGLRCNTEYNIKVVAVNGNGFTMKKGRAKKAAVMTTQDAGVQDTYYARITGNFSNDIWSSSPTGPPQKLPPLSPCLKLVVQSPVSVTMDIDASFGELEIETGGRLILNGKTINLQKDLVINGSLNHNGGRFVFDGTAGIQEIITASEIEFYDIEVNKNAQQFSNELIISGDIGIRNHMTITAGNLQVRTGFALRLISDVPDQAAALTQVPTGSTISGNFIVERNLPEISTTAPSGSGQGVGWRYLSAPVKGATFAIWDDDFTTTGLTNSDYPEYPYNINPIYYYFPNLQFYDETVDGVFEVGFDGDPNGAAPNIRVRRDISQPIQAGQGVFAYLGPVPLTFDAIGEPFTGELTVNLSYTNHGLPDDDGWHLVANPYPSAIDWDLVYQSSGSITPFAYIFDATGTGNYIQIEAGGTNHLIASSNAFWVKSTGPGSQVVFRELQKTPDTTVPFYKSLNDDQNELIISLINTNDSTLGDFTTLRLNTSATAGYDADYDAYKWYSLHPLVPGIATRIDSSDRDFSINAFDFTDTTLHIPLAANIRLGGIYSFNFEFSGTQFHNYCMMLIDHLTGNQVVVENGNTYEFEAQPNTATDSARFELIFTPALKTEVYAATCNGGNNGEIVAFAYGNTPVTYSLFDADGTLFTSGTALGEFTIDSLFWGFYQLEMSDFSAACPSLTRVLFIGQPAPFPPAGVTAYNALCTNSFDGEITVEWQDSSFYQLALFKENELIDFVADASVYRSFGGLSQGEYMVQISNVCDTVQIAKSVSVTDSMHLDFLVPEDTIYLAEDGYVFYQNISENASGFRWGFHPDQEAPIESENGEFTYTEAGVYDVVLSGTSIDGCVGFKTRQITVLDQVTSVYEGGASGDDRFSISYPNNQVYLNYWLGQSASLNLSVYDGLGKVYFKKTLHANQQGNYVIPAENMAPGIYFIRIDRNDKESFMLRFVIPD